MSTTLSASASAEAFVGGVRTPLADPEATIETAVAGVVAAQAGLRELSSADRAAILDRDRGDAERGRRLARRRARRRGAVLDPQRHGARGPAHDRRLHADRRGGARGLRPGRQPRRLAPRARHAGGRQARADRSDAGDHRVQRADADRRPQAGARDRHRHGSGFEALAARAARRRRVRRADRRRGLARRGARRPAGRQRGDDGARHRSAAAGHLLHRRRRRLGDQGRGAAQARPPRAGRASGRCWSRPTPTSTRWPSSA